MLSLYIQIGIPILESWNKNPRKGALLNLTQLFIKMAVKWEQKLYLFEGRRRDGVVDTVSTQVILVTVDCKIVKKRSKERNR